MELSKCQQNAYDKFVNGDNLFISGPGGTGKSYFIQEIYKFSKRENKNIYVTSLTGCSAVLLNCNAMTIHKWAMLGIKYDDPEKVISRIRRYKQQRKILETDILIIDEVSMLNKQTFETIDYICKRFRRSKDPFGGIQIICSGDFYQLPPIGKTDEEKKFCFESDKWNETFDHHIVFTENFRQCRDPEYTKILNEIRTGNISHESYEELIKCCKKSVSELEIKPTTLFPTKRQTDEVNHRQLNNLDSNDEFIHYINKFHRDQETTFGKNIQDELNNQLKNSMCESELILKKGAQVMCISNIDQERNLVNGAQGVIIGFENSDDGMYAKYPVVKFENIPYPEVIKPHTWMNEKYEKFGVIQVPLILSWAITIHKSQGLSLDKAMINIGSNIFEYGQTYVALSRVKSIQGLYLENINIHKIRANPKVKSFYSSLKHKQGRVSSCSTELLTEKNKVSIKKQKSTKTKSNSTPNKLLQSEAKTQTNLDSFLKKMTYNSISNSNPSSSS